jgi:hypothetical protein
MSGSLKISIPQLPLSWLSFPVYLKESLLLPKVLFVHLSTNG